ncbi:MAG: methionine--tRNA ligase [Elusimicrobia bacterium RIFOXYB2_FULL_48_7]|nr:MAG: methionine--tRNA ligase [Elusimicrobia bacterium RIFOXYB2_FULL_48_7]
MKKPFYITTPIYYVNDAPHIGHTYTTVAADVLSRWARLRSIETFFLTGTDEHGGKILEAAKEKHKEPKDYCDEISGKYAQAWEQMDISYDRFIRTTDPHHQLAVEKFISNLHSNGDIYKSKYEGLYCLQCEKFLSPGDLQDNACPDHKTAPEKHCEENYFFKLSKYREQLVELISNKNHPKHFEILPEERRNEILGKLKLGLEDISISRENLPWAIPMPFDRSQTIYVWIDALINYVSAIGYGNGPENTDTEEFTRAWPVDIHLLAKDILWFHCVIWPAMLLANNLPLPKRVFAHGFFTINGQKMSKTIGNIIKPAELVEIFGVDASRFLLLNAFPFGADGDISIAAFKEKYNAHLANNIGNLVSRATNMATKYYNGTLAKPSCWEPSVFDELKPMFLKYENSMENLKLNEVLDSVIAVSSFANQYIDRQAPWNLAKTDTAKLQVVLYDSMMIVKYIAALLSPFMPSAAEKIWKTLDEKDTIASTIQKMPAFMPLTGSAITKPENLFPKMPIPTDEAGRHP